MNINLNPEQLDTAIELLNKVVEVQIVQAVLLALILVFSAVKK